MTSSRGVVKNRSPLAKRCSAQPAGHVLAGGEQDLVPGFGGGAGQRDSASMAALSLR
jgi:hypothetical protein